MADATHERVFQILKNGETRPFDHSGHASQSSVEFAQGPIKGKRGNEKARKRSFASTAAQRPIWTTK